MEAEVSNRDEVELNHKASPISSSWLERYTDNVEVWQFNSAWDYRKEEKKTSLKFCRNKVNAFLLQPQKNRGISSAG